jgi:hypothetical protein
MGQERGCEGVLDTADADRHASATTRCTAPADMLHAPATGVQLLRPCVLQLCVFETH